MSVILGGSNGITYPNGTGTPAADITTQFTPTITDTSDVMTIRGGVRVIGSTGISANNRIATTNSGAYSYTTPGTYYFTVPTGVTSVQVTTVGGGGGGQAGNGNYSGSGGAGAGGAAGTSVTQTLTVTAGAVLTVVVGAGGAGGVAYVSGGTSANGAAGSAGGDSYIATYGATNAAGGAGGNKATSAGNFPGAYPNGNWAGDGGSWWYGYAGANSSVGVGGTAGGIYTNGGVGGQGSGGGGGAASNYSPNDYSTSGGAGGSGLVTIRYVQQVVFGDATVNTTTSTRAGASYTWTVPAGVSSITINAAGGGGGAYAYHDGGYGQHAWAGGPGGGVQNLILPVTPGDIISGVYGNGGGCGYYSGGIGGPGSATTIYKNGALVASCGAGGQNTGGAPTAGTANIYMGSGTLKTGTVQTAWLDTSDGAYPYGLNHYDPWSWVLEGSPSYPQSVLGTVAVEAPAKLGTNYQRAGMPQVCGWVSITW